MKFGMFYPVAVASEAELGNGLWGLDRNRYDRTIQELREQAICADETGWTSMMFAEHHFEIEGYHVTPNPLMLNVYLAQHTKRLRQGQMGLVLPNWNPLRLAEDIAMADHLTGGRLDIGLSRGYQPRSVGVMGQHYRANAAGTGRPEVEAVNRRIVEEWFEVMRRSWTEDLWDYQGEFISVPPKGVEWKHPISARLNAGVKDGILAQVATVPKPKQLPYPPLFTTLSQSPETLTWSARIGASVVTLAADLDIVRWLFQSYVDEAEKHGRKLRFGEYSSRGGVVLSRNVAVGKTHEDAMETARQGSAFWTHWLGEFGFFEALRMKGQEGPVPKTFEQMLKSGMQIVGTPDEVGEEIQRLKDTLNVDYMIFIMYAGMTEHKRMLESIQLFGEKVIPKFADTKVPESKVAAVCWIGETHDGPAGWRLRGDPLRRPGTGSSGNHAACGACRDSRQRRRRRSRNRSGNCFPAYGDLDNARLRQPHAQPALHPRCAVVAACLGVDRPFAAGGGCAHATHRRRLRRDRLSPAAGWQRSSHACAADRGAARLGRRGNWAELSAMGDGRRAGTPRHTAGRARLCAATGGAVPGLHA